MLTMFRSRKWPDLIAKANQRRCRAALADVAQVELP
jgi:hypothetical protein